MLFIKNKIVQKMLSLGLSAALIYNTTVPALGQEFSFKEMPYLAPVEMAVDGTALRREVSRQISEEINEAYHAPKTLVEKRKAQKNSVYARALEIKRSILGDPEAELKGVMEETFTDVEFEDNSPKQQYINSLNKEYENAKAEITARHQANIEYIQANGLQGKLAEENQVYKNVLKELDNYIKQAINSADKIEEEFRAHIENNPDAFYNYVRPLIKELMDLYAQNPEQVKEHILELTSVIVGLVNEAGEHLYTAEQANTLKELYLKVIEEEKIAAETEEVGEIKGAINKYILKKNNADKFKGPEGRICKSYGYCPYLTSAFLGLSALAEENEVHNYGDLIFNTMLSFHDTAANVAVLNAGFSALLVMKDYEAANNFIINRIKNEANIRHDSVGQTISDSLDYINFMKIAESIANTNGKYLGRSSSFGQYEDEDGNPQNSYFDLAQILAADGSKEALDILRKNSVERCLVKQTSGVNKDTFAKFTISCGGIKPFLVGALMSGKSGANEYNLPVSTRLERYQTPNGDWAYKKQTNTPEASAIIKANEDYKSLADKQYNGDAAAMVATSVMTNAMGDLDAKNEYAIDSMLYTAFKDNIPEELLQSKYVITDQVRKGKKDTRHTVRAAFMGLGLAGDVFLTITCVTFLYKLGSAILSIGRGVFNAFKIAKAGVTFKQLSSLGKFAQNFKAAFLASDVIAPRVAKMKTFVSNYKELVGGFAKSTANQYTSLVDAHAAEVLATARQGTKITPRLVDVARLMRYDEALDGFKFAYNLDNVGYSKQLQVLVKSIFDKTLIAAKDRMRFGKLFKKNPNFSTVFLEEANKVVMSSGLGVRDQQALMKFFRSASFEPVLNTAAKNVNLIKASAANNFSLKPLVLSTFLGTKKGETPVGMKLVISDNIPAFSGKVPEFASVVQEGDSFLLKLIGGSGEKIDFSAFKLTFADSESFRNLARVGAKMGGVGSKIEIKFIPKEADTFWFRNFKKVFGSKEKIFGGKGEVFLVKDGQQLKTGITIKTYKKYDGLKVFVQDDLNGVISAVKDGEDLPLTLKGSFRLPKYQLGNLLKFSQSKDLTAPLNVKLIGGKNKINALYFQSVVSLSAASTGLVGPLRKNYPEMKTEQLALIALVFPYLLSALTPFVSPLVKRYGAIKVLKTSMGLSLASLALPVAAGFTGFGGIQADNPFEKPSPLFLYPSAFLIGLATTLTRGSYSPLIQSIGGGSGTLKAVAFKSISGFVMIIPPLLGAVIDDWHPKYFTNPDGSLYLNENGEKVQKHWFDFSFSYPVILAVSATSLYFLQKSHFNKRIGKEAGYAIGGVKGFFKEAGASYGVLLGKEMRPLTISSALLAGAESSLLYHYATSKGNEYVRNEIETESLIPVIAMLGIGVPAFFTRINSKPYLKMVGGDNLLGYRNMTTLSLSFAGAGGYLMMKKDDPVSFTAGMALASIGFSQLTSSILRYGHVKLAKELSMPTRVVTSWDVSYPTVFFGMSAVPYLYGAAADKTIEGLKIEDKNDMISMKNTASKNVLWVPMAALGFGAAAAYKGMHMGRSLRSFTGHGVVGSSVFFGETQNPYIGNILSPKPVKPTFLNAPVKLNMDAGFKDDFIKTKAAENFSNIPTTQNFKMAPLAN